MCAACTVAARHRELWELGFVLSEKRFMQAFKDCGVAVETIAADHTVWVPCWAEQIRGYFIGTHDLAPLLGRCAVDAEFADAIIAVGAIAEHAIKEAGSSDMVRAAVARKMRAFAIGQGVLAELTLHDER